MKLLELFNEGEVVPFSKKAKKPENKPFHIPKPSNDREEIDWEEELKDDPDYKPGIGLKDQDDVDELVRWFVNLGPGGHALYDNRLIQIIKAPDDHRFIISFDDTHEKKIIGRWDLKLTPIPKEHH